MAEYVKAEYLLAEDESGNPLKVQFLPPAPQDEDLGGITAKERQQIAELDKKIGDVGVKAEEQYFGLAWIYWTNNLDTGVGIENDAISYSKHDLIATQRLNLKKLADSKPAFSEKSKQILKRAKELNPKLRQFDYIQADSGRKDFTYEGDHAHLNPDGSWEGSTAQLSGSSRIYTFEQFCDWFDWFKETGCDGVFFDDWGYDFAKEDICYQFGWDPDEIADLKVAKNKKWAAIVDACHERGLSVITNGGIPFDVGDWYTHLDENDVIAMESCMISSAGNIWNNGHRLLYNYYETWYSTGKCKAKIWSLDYFPGSAKDCRNQVLTYLCAMALTCGAHYVSMGVCGFIEKPPLIEMFVRGNNKKIVKLDDNTYQLSVGRHILESHRWRSLSGIVSAETAARNYFLLDGEKFNDAYASGGIALYKNGEEIAEINKKIGSMTEDTRKNALSYWRIAIDDWNPDLSYLDFTNLLLFSPKCSSHSGATIELVKNDDGTVDIVCNYPGNDSSNPNIRCFDGSNYEKIGQTGKGLEFGFADVIFEMEEGSWTLPNGTPYYGSMWGVPSFRPFLSIQKDGVGTAIPFISSIGSEFGEKTGYYARTSAAEFEEAMVYVWSRAPQGGFIKGKITIKKAYLIDIGEHEDEVGKKWYTNIFPTSFNVASGMTATETGSTKNGWKTFDIVAETKDRWGWSVYKLGADEVIALRGHTLEIGCSELIFSNGMTGKPGKDGVNYAVGVGINKEKNDPNSYRLYSDTANKSSVWDESIKCCVQFTVPYDATTMCVGFKSYAYPSNLVVTMKNAYLYDLNEKVTIRGESSTNASLRLCRVTEEQEETTPSKLRNALYITEKGRAYCYDIKGGRVDIAGAIYAGAVEAGYKGTPDQLGSTLYQLITNAGLVESGGTQKETAT